MKASQKIAWTVFGVLVLLTIVCGIMAINAMVVFPWFRLVPMYLIVLTIIVGFVAGLLKKRERKNKMMFYILYPLLSILFLAPILFAWLLLTVREFHTEYPSPSGEKVVVLEYDIASAPSVYLKQGGIFMRRLTVPKLYGGVNETKQCELTWISENEFELRRYDDEEPVRYRFE